MTEAEAGGANEADTAATLASAREQQAAVSDILRVISRSPKDLQAVFDVIATSARRFCSAEDAMVALVEGDRLVGKAHDGAVGWVVGSALLDRQLPAARCIVDARTIHVRDMQTDTSEDFRTAREIAAEYGIRTVLATPMLHGGKAIGSITLRRTEVHPFTDEQIELVRTFADQAAIAIENVRLFNETKDALAQQTALSEVLKTISRSAFDLDAVLQTIVERAAALCQADGAAIYRRAGSVAIAAATFGDVGTVPGDAIAIDDQTVVGRGMLRGERQYIPDAREHPDLPQDGPNTRLNIPFVRDGVAIGALAVLRRVARPFNDSELRLFEVFADQAAIAIENVRLFNETKASLEQQTALGEVLRTMASSPADLGPVLDAIARNAARFCAAEDSGVALLRPDGLLEQVAHYGPISRALPPWPVDRGSVRGRAIVDRRVVHVADMLAESEEDYPTGVRRAREVGQRTVLAAPLLRGGVPLGAIALRRTEVRPFTEKQIELLRTFADQAAIAIENVRLFNETKESLERQTALAEILRVIASSPSDQQPVFDAIALNATRYCGAEDAAVQLVQGDESVRVAHHGAVPYQVGPNAKLERTSVAGRAILDARTVHVADITGPAGDEFPTTRQRAAVTGQRGMLATPLLREGKAIGAILLRKMESGGFTPSQIQLVEAFADQAVITIENVRLFNETKEALKQRTATSEILRVISETLGDPQPVMQAIVDTVLAVCSADSAGFFRRSGDDLILRAVSGTWRGPRPSDVVPQLPFHGDSIVVSALEEGRYQHVADTSTDPRYDAAAQWSRTRLAVPVLRGSETLGVIRVGRAAPGGFSEREIRLVEGFAEQAAIAFENARLFNETKESLDQQIATAELLEVISRSTNDLTPVFDAVLEKAIQLCGADNATIRLRDGDEYRHVATLGMTAEMESAWVEYNEIRLSVAPGRETLTQRVASARAPVQIVDILSNDEFYPRLQQVEAERPGMMQGTMLGVPLLRDGEVIGVILARRVRVRAFTDRQIRLFETFARQATIAIENVRLFNETREALERQTAIGGILRVMSSSPTDVQPVLDTIAKSAAEFCGAPDVLVNLLEGGDRNLTRAHHGDLAIVPQDESAFTDRHVAGRAFTDRSVSGRAMIERRTIHLQDLQAEAARYPGGAAASPTTRAILAAPLLRMGEPIGTIILRRSEAIPFTGRQIELAETFADQAAIAIQNVRLFNETKEALERQTSISDVLQTIGRSAFDLQPVLDTVVERAVKLCDAREGSISTLEDDVYRTRAYWSASSLPPAYIDFMRQEVRTPDRGSLTGRTALEGRVVHIADVLEDSEYTATDMQQAAGYRTLLGVPLLRDGKVIGVFALTRSEVRPFSDRQIELVRTFADQAAIAIENTRLFVATKEALEQQTAVSEVLKTISRSAFDLQPVLDIVLNNAVRLAGADIGWLSRVENEQFMTVAYSAEFPESVKEELARQRAQGHLAGPWLPLGTGGGLMGFTLAEGRTVHLPDVKEDAALKGSVVARLTASRTVVGVPMIRDDRTIGGMVLARYEVRPFGERELELVQTFADQAAIAIENVRLFDATRESLEQQTSISNVLRTISRSTFDIEPTLRVVLESAARLCDADAAWMTQSTGDGYSFGASYGRNAELLARLVSARGPRKGFLQKEMEPRRIGSRVYLERKTINVVDIATDPSLRESLTALDIGARSVVAVPVLHEGQTLGAMMFARVTVRPFTAREIQVVETFADQAGIAIQNVRLFNEIQDKSRQLEVASRHKSEFLANMSHELRTPLNAIIGFSEVLMHGLFGDVNEKQREYLQDVVGSGQHLLSLINDILDLSKIEAGRMELELSSFSFGDALASGITIVRERASRHNITIAVVSDELGQVEADERKVKQILYNLLSNAVKFTPDGGRVVVSVRRDNGGVRVEVRDNGIGIAEADQARVFEEFQQVGRERSREGTGLGLTLTKRFVELHGGRIWLESAPGQGSTFTFTLPLRQAAPVRA